MEKSILTLILDNLKDWRTNEVIFESAHQEFIWNLTDAPQRMKLYPDRDEELNRYWMRINLDIDGLDDEGLEILDENKFTILHELELCLGQSFSESTDNDACSWRYEFNTNHATDKVTFSITITDYLS